MSSKPIATPLLSATASTPTEIACSLSKAQLRFWFRQLIN
jgi:hypothetical protein